jgi:hypothetical protein
VGGVGGVGGVDGGVGGVVGAVGAVGAVGVDRISAQDWSKHLFCVRSLVYELCALHRNTPAVPCTPAVACTPAVPAVPVSLLSLWLEYEARGRRT